MNPNKAWFSLTYEDIQNQAQSEIGRQLTDDEFAFVIHRAGQGIEWIEPVCIAIGML
jgi:hypothetical protein